MSELIWVVPWHQETSFQKLKMVLVTAWLHPDQWSQNRFHPRKRSVTPSPDFRVQFNAELRKSRVRPRSLVQLSHLPWERKNTTSNSIFNCILNFNFFSSENIFMISRYIRNHTFKKYIYYILTKALLNLTIKFWSICGKISQTDCTHI